MNKEGMFNYLFIAISVLLFILTASNLIELPSDMQNLTTINKTPAQFTPSELDRIDIILQKKNRSDTFSYTGQFESPFRSGFAENVTSKSFKKSLLPKRTKLSLKGILIKNTPLAILEDEKGETYIRGTGEKALDQEIIRISESKVMLRDGLGTYELTVQEQ
jgi:hypothetical protein